MNRRGVIPFNKLKIIIKTDCLLSLSMPQQLIYIYIYIYIGVVTGRLYQITNYFGFIS